jgi:hypothetical protein
MVSARGRAASIWTQPRRGPVVESDWPGYQRARVPSAFVFRVHTRQRDQAGNHPTPSLAPLVYEPSQPYPSST